MEQMGVYKELVTCENHLFHGHRVDHFRLNKIWLDNDAVDHCVIVKNELGHRPETFYKIPVWQVQWIEEVVLDGEFIDRVHCLKKRNIFVNRYKFDVLNQ
jgi:hypothetical protein